MAKVSARHHNNVLKRAERRALELEDQLVGILVPILEQAGEVAAENFRSLAVNHLTACALALTAADLGVTSLSTMVCLRPRPEQAAALADEDGYPPERLHVTLCYLGEVEGDLQPIADALQPVAVTHAPLHGIVGGYGQFGTPDGPVGILLPDVPGLVELRVAVTEALIHAGIDYARDHGFAAHLTFDSDPEPDELEEGMQRYQQPLDFDELLVVRGDTEEIPLRFVGVPPLTAAAVPRFCLPAAVRTKTDPVRLAVAQTVMGTAVEEAGLVFDVANPFAAKVLAQSASQVTSIAQTTQLQVMRTIGAAHKEGLSIPDTARAIQAVMEEAAPARARLIARTELSGAVNGGSLAATQIVAEATGDHYTKSWLTAPGATFPRHEDYDGLDGQVAELDGYFDVGGAQLQFPGDPDGPPDEVCNCRCALVYTGEGAPAAEEAETGSASREAALDLAGQVAAEYRALTAAGPSPWTAPAPEEILPISCESPPAVASPIAEESTPSPIVGEPGWLANL